MIACNSRVDPIQPSEKRKSIGYLPSHSVYRRSITSGATSRLPFVNGAQRRLLLGSTRYHYLLDVLAKFVCNLCSLIPRLSNPPNTLIPNKARNALLNASIYTARAAAA